MSVSRKQLSAYGVGRRRPDDPFFKAGNNICNAMAREGVFDTDDEDLCHNITEEFSCHVPGCTQSFTTMYDYELHYNGSHRFMCSECQKQLPSAHLLDLHLSELHDAFFKAQAERKAMYQCLVEECKLMFHHAEERRSHCIDFHKYPGNFVYFNVLHKPKKAKKKTTPTNPSLESDAEGTSESSGKFSVAKSGGKKRRVEWFKLGGETSSDGMDVDVNAVVQDLLNSLPDTKP